MSGTDRLMSLLIVFTLVGLWLAASWQVALGISLLIIALALLLRWADLGDDRPDGWPPRGG